eukprot:scaffold16396_cov140-Cylindrotheca_fusiformis.AAC.4
MIRVGSGFGVGLRRSRLVVSRPSLGGASLSKSTDEESNTETPTMLSLSGTAQLVPSEIGLSLQRRHMSSDAKSPKPNFDETMDKLFHEAQKEANGADDAWFLDEATDVVFEPSWWNLADQAVSGVQWVHELTGLHYAGSIFATTCALRLVILPLAVRGQRAASRMAHVQPELAMIKQRYEALGTPTQAEQKAFAEQMKALFARYDVKPFATLAAPLIQAPLFIGMFFGMKKMPDIFTEEMSTGGIFWFTDLTIPDPTYILPIMCGVSFLTTIEAGKEQMIDSNAQYGPVMVNAFRAMAVVMIPVMTTFPAAMLCYWVPNNLFTLLQSVTLRNSFVKKQLGIWDRPKPIPGSNTDAGFQETMTNLVKKAKGEPTTEAEMLKKHNEEIETRKRVKQMSKVTRARRKGGD